jgi:hypothetical protein
MKQLGINPAMDKLMQPENLSHEQVFSDLENDIFNPAETLEYLELTNLSLENLRRVKKLLAEQPTPDLPKQPTLVQVPFEYPRDGALYFTKSYRHQVKIAGFFGSDNKKITGFIDGISNNSFWCSETGKAVNPFGDTVISNDLIMFVWE